MLRELPECSYKREPMLVYPSKPTPKHTLYLSNIDNQKFLQFFIKIIFVYKVSIPIDDLKSSLSRVLLHYYPFAGRMRKCKQNIGKFEVDCNGEGVVLAEAFMNISMDEFLESYRTPPHLSWSKNLLIYSSEEEAVNFLGIPPLVIQVTYLSCGGMIICTMVNHLMCDGFGLQQFLQAWAHLHTKPDADLPIQPYHSREILNPTNPLQITSHHPEFIKKNPDSKFDIHGYLQSQPLVPCSVTFTCTQIQHLQKKLSLKCTKFETLASHVWCCWVKALRNSFPLPCLHLIKLLFSIMVREKIKPKLPEGYYGNGFVLGSVETTVEELVNEKTNLHHGVALIQECKIRLTNEHLRSMIDLLEVNIGIQHDLSSTLVITEWVSIGRKLKDFGQGTEVHMGPLVSKTSCVFGPLLSAGDGNIEGMNVIISMPEKVVEKFKFYLMNK
ncbi:hypothetical protein MKW94_004539 [Papaver nudicaule]|uniref:Uncharacterized protein n=1 Tax=Papaver nudicaule TaxID=74823 RepID=A0AA41RXC6_PAPNU|nr:hypothetical protein [Papaver nudicaule]